MAAANELLPSPSYLDSDSIDDYDNPGPLSPDEQGDYDFLPEGPKCKCCPYGYHVDVGFVQYAEDAKRGKYLRHLEQIQRYKKKLRQTMEVFYKQHGRYPPMINPPDLIKSSEADSESFTGSGTIEEAGAAGGGEDEDTFAVFGTTEHHSHISRGGSSKTVQIKAKEKAAARQQSNHALNLAHTHTQESASFATVSTADTQQHTTSPDASECADCQRMYQRAVATEGECHACQTSCPQCTTTSLSSFVGQQHEALRQVETHVTETSETEQVVQITREQLTKIREQMASSLARLRELEALVKNQPLLEARLRVVLEEKDLLQVHLEEKEQEMADFKSKYEESLVQVSTLETMRMKDEVDFQQKISVVESKIPPPVRSRDVGVGSGDVRELYFLQPLLLRNYKTDCQFDIPESILSTLRTRWESEFRRMEAQRAPIMRNASVAMVPTVNSVSVDAKPLVQHADVWQSVDMDDEEWRSKELNFSGDSSMLSWFQQQVSSSREQHTIIQALRRAYQVNHSEFKSLIIRLLAKSLRSQAVQVYPDMCNAGVMTNGPDVCHQGVSEDRVDVIVRPQVPCYSVGVGARPDTLNKIMFTDRIFKYDAVTSTLPTPVSDAATVTEREKATTFSFGVQTEAARLREQSILTDKVDIIDRRLLQSKSSNTEPKAVLAVATNTEPASCMDRAIAIEARRMYETSVCTDPPRTSNKKIGVDLTPPMESTPISNIDSFATSVVKSSVKTSTTPVVAATTMSSEIRQESLPSPSTEQTTTETWEEVTYFDREANVVRASAPECSHVRSSVSSESDAVERSALSARASSRSSERRVQTSSRSRSHGGEASMSSRRESGSIEFGGGTVRPGDPLPDFASDTKVSTNSSSFQRSSESSALSEKTISTSMSESVSGGFARSRIPMSHLKEEKEDAVASMTSMTSSFHEGSARTTRSKVDVKSSDLYIACQTFARWMKDSTTTTSKQMNEAEASIRQFWFRLVGSRTSRHDVVEPYLTAIRELGVSVLAKVINMADDTGNTGIHYAVSNSNWPLVQAILDTCPVQLERLNRAGYSVLMLAALCEAISPEQVAIMKRLVTAAANVDLCSSSGAGQTALMLAASHGRLPMVEALLKAGANPNLQDKDGSTALMCASEHGHTEVVRAMLANQRTDCNLKDGEGCTALSIAMENNHRDISLLIYARENLSKTTVSKGKRALPRRHIHISDKTSTFKYK